MKAFFLMGFPLLLLSRYMCVTFSDRILLALTQDVCSVLEPLFNKGNRIVLQEKVP